MKYIHYFESIKNPKIGDYVVCYEEDEITKSTKDIPGFLEFISNNVGRYIDVFDSDVFPYEIQYQNIPENIKEYYFNDDGTRQFSRKQIIFYSKSKEKAEIFIQSKKYNL